jgi:hypothetical protein
MLLQSFTVDSPNVTYSDDCVTSSYEYDTTELECGPGLNFTVRPVSHKIEFQTSRRVPKVGYAAGEQNLIAMLFALCFALIVLCSLRRVSEHDTSHHQLSYVASGGVNRAL